MKKERIVIALGGNALQADPNQGSAANQLQVAKQSAKPLVELIAQGHEVVIAHGNGPQVGQIIAAYENIGKEVMPFPECGAMSQGYIGYHLQQAIRMEMLKNNIEKGIASIVTQVVVDKDDRSFENPTKPIGAFYSAEDSKVLREQKGYAMVEDSGRGWRRVVPSPEPMDIVEAPVIKSLVDAGHVVITVGGGGIPVIDKGEGELEGIPAVIDKDFASEKLAELLDADYLVILTGVEKVAIHFNTPQQKNLDRINIHETEQYIRAGHFAPGSMLPKIQAALKFVKSKPGRRVLITSLNKIKEGIEGKTGTLIIGE